MAGPKMDDRELGREIPLVAQAWADSPYYADAERWTYLFWNEGTSFRRLFDRLDLASVVELACGHGRHAVQIVDRSGQLTLIDIFEQHLAVCRQRLSGYSNVNFIRGDGHTFDPIEAQSISAIFCYDAMVHFGPNMVQSYLHDAHRVLRPGGMALFHHSNYPAPLNQHYGLNPHARNHMTKALFAEYSATAGLAVVESIVMPWGGVADLDCISLVRKAS